jgi:DNA integrity scanning protein DisA with diadenylate cyclase activity
MELKRNNTIVHIEELLSVFHDIDSRIMELHENSSQVFLQLNEFLKDYHRKNSIVSNNATQIFDTIAGNKETCLTCELNHIFNDFENYRNETDNELEMNLSTS